MPLKNFCYLVTGLACGLLLTACGGSSSSTNSDETGHDLVFQGNLTGNLPELLILEANGEVRRLLPEGTAITDPKPSPDGTRIAFVVADYQQSIGDIYIINRDGTGLMQLTFAPELDDQPAWSPDGTRIAFRSYRTERDGDIWVMDADGANPLLLTPDPLPGVTDENHPAWSPDGTRIAYTSNAAGNIDLWTMAADGSDPRQITSTADLDAEPAWSPNGEIIAFRRSGEEIGSDIYLVPAEGGEPLGLLLAGEQRMPVWTPDGAGLVIVHHASPTDRSDLYSVAPDGSDLQPLVTDQVPYGSLSPAFLKRN